MPLRLITVLMDIQSQNLGSADSTIQGWDGPTQSTWHKLMNGTVMEKMKEQFELAETRPRKAARRMTQARYLNKPSFNVPTLSSLSKR
jgi:hypothetical protein